MKFLCVACDEQMKLVDTVSHRDIGSLSVVYACPQCESKTAMLTNAAETQMVQSLGVKIGPDGEKTASKCPFSQALTGESAPHQDGVFWTEEANERLEKVPDFVRPMAKVGIEQFAEERGYPKIDARVLDEAKAVFGF